MATLAAGAEFLQGIEQAEGRAAARSTADAGATDAMDRGPSAALSMPPRSIGKDWIGLALDPLLRLPKAPPSDERFGRGNVRRIAEARAGFRDRSNGKAATSG
jgi:hypothetical protein